MEIFEALNQEAKHVAEIGLLVHATDEEIVRYARRHRQVVVTRDMDFGTLAVYHGVPVYGIVILSLPFTATAAMTGAENPE